MTHFEITFLKSFLFQITYVKFLSCATQTILETYKKIRRNFPADFAMIGPFAKTADAVSCM